MKECTKCGKSKKVTEFYERYRRAGTPAICKTCCPKERRRNAPMKYKLQDRFLGY